MARTDRLAPNQPDAAQPPPAREHQQQQEEVVEQHGTNLPNHEPHERGGTRIDSSTVPLPHQEQPSASEPRRWPLWALLLAALLLPSFVADPWTLDSFPVFVMNLVTAALVASAALVSSRSAEFDTASFIIALVLVAQSIWAVARLDRWLFALVMLLCSLRSQYSHQADVGVLETLTSVPGSIIASGPAVVLQLGTDFFDLFLWTLSCATTRLPMNVRSQLALSLSLSMSGQAQLISSLQEGRMLSTAFFRLLLPLAVSFFFLILLQAGNPVFSSFVDAAFQYISKVYSFSLEILVGRLPITVDLWYSLGLMAALAVLVAPHLNRWAWLNSLLGSGNDIQASRTRWDWNLEYACSLPSVRRATR